MPERTFAVIKPGFLDQRLNIETHLTEAGFDIIKERQLEFHPEDEALGELFGDEAQSLKGGPVWVYVLERDNAIEDLLAVVGDKDPAVARENAPSSLRAIYGQSLEDNVIYAAPDVELASIQINSIFVSSPPFPPANEDELDEVPVLTDTGLHNRERQMSYDSQGSDSKRPSGVNLQFRARGVPSTTAVPSITPRMSRAAALRAGLVEVKSAEPAKPRAPLSKEEMARTFANVPGHKRSSTIAVASTAKPQIAPRATRASLLREGKDKPAPAPRVRSSANTTAETPGYKRNLKIAVASTAAPTIAPRQTRASLLRTGGPTGSSPKRPSTAPSRPSGTFGPPPPKGPVQREQKPKTEGTFVGVPGHKRAESIQVASTRPPTEPPRLNRSATLRARKQSEEGGTSPPSTVRASRPPSSAAASSSKPSYSASETDSRPRTESVTSSSGKSSRPAPLTISRGRAGEVGPPSSYRGPRDDSPERERERGRTQSRPSSVASVSRAPSIEPKTNRAALLRARAGTPNGGQQKFVWV